MAMNPPRTTHAHRFLRTLALEILNEPAMAPRTAIAQFDAHAQALLASEVAMSTLTAAHHKLSSSDATIAFEGLCASSRDALIDSVERTFGAQAAKALCSDSDAFHALPERSSCQLCAWRFPDGSFLFCSRSADDSLGKFAAALRSCPLFLTVIGPDKDEAIARAMTRAQCPDGVFPLSRDALFELLSGMILDGQWRPGTRMLSREGSRLMDPADVLASLEIPESNSATLDQLISNTVSTRA